MPSPLEADRVGACCPGSPRRFELVPDVLELEIVAEVEIFDDGEIGGVTAKLEGHPVELLVDELEAASERAAEELPDMIEAAREEARERCRAED